MESLLWLASCLEQGRTAIAPTLANPGHRKQIERLRQVGALTLVRARVVICPRCEAHAVEIVAKDQGICEDCGLIDVTQEHMQRLMPDGSWLRRRMAQALGMHGESALEVVPGRVWHIGDMGRAGQRHRILFGQQLGDVLVQRVLHSAWPCYIGKTPAILVTTTPEDRVYLPGIAVRLVPLVSAFRVRGGGLVADVAVWAGVLEKMRWRAASHERIGPFAHDFRDVLLSGESRPIALTPAQSALLKVLWEQQGMPMRLADLVLAARVGVEKPIHAFQRQKYPEANRAYHALVCSDLRGRYWIRQPESLLL